MKTSSILLDSLFPFFLPCAHCQNWRIFGARNLCVYNSITVCRKTASRNTSFLVTCLVKKHHLFDKPIPKNLHSQLETCVCTCNFMVKKWSNNLRKKVTDILATIFPQFLTLCSGASSFWLPWMVVFWVSDFPNKLFFSFSCFSTSEWEERSYPKQD